MDEVFQWVSLSVRQPRTEILNTEILKYLQTDIPTNFLGRRQRGSEPVAAPGNLDGSPAALARELDTQLLGRVLSILDFLRNPSEAGAGFMAEPVLPRGVQ